MKIIFMGTPDFAQKSLKALYESKNDIVAVVTNQDKPKGRGMKLIASPVKDFAIEKNLKIYQPEKVRNNEQFIDEIKKLNPDLLCVVAYGKILPKELLDIPKYGAINVHGSLLPKYRGAAPIQWAVLNGDKETGVTIIFMDEGMDTGDIILKEKVQIGDDETTGELWERLSNIGAKLLIQTVDKIEEVTKNIESVPENEMNKELDDIQKEKIREEVKNKIGAEKQNEEYSFAPMIKKEMSTIDWGKSASEIKNLVRGLNPIMGAVTFFNGKKIKIWKVKAINKIEDLFDEAFYNKKELNDNNFANAQKENLRKEYEKQQCGEPIIVDKKKGLFVKTGKGIIEILEIQGENGKRMDIKSFLNGNDIF